MSEVYIKPAGAFKKLKRAFELKQPVYIYGATGFGKTEMVRKFLDGRNYFYISCMTQMWDISELLEKKEQKRVSIAVIDDLQFLTNNVCREEVLSLIRKSSIQTVLIGRAKFPSWLLSSFFSNTFCVIDEGDLGLSEYEMKQFFLAEGIGISDKEISDIRIITSGHPFALKCCFPYLNKGDFDWAIKEASDIFGQHLTENVYPFYDNDVLDFLCKVSVVDEFTPELAKMITGIDDIDDMLRRCEENADFFSIEKNVIKIRPQALEGFRRYLEKNYNKQSVLELHHNAAMYYQMNGRDIQALKMFSMIGNSERVLDILIRNSHHNPGEGSYYEMREYYSALTDRQVESNFHLMSGLSMLYSLLMDAEKSEYWYNRLLCKKDGYRGAVRKKAEIMLAYLDIALPHRKSDNMLAIVQKSFEVMIRSGMRLPALGITSNLPSILNGGKDFCRWTKYDNDIVEKYGKMVCAILGIDEKHIAKLALGESYYEKGESAENVLSYLSQLNIDAKSGDGAELEFVAAALKTRLLLCEEGSDSAEKCFDGFIGKLESLNKEKILVNANAMKCRLAMYSGDAKSVEKWYKIAPDENNDYFIMDRFLYMVKIRCYILYKKYISASGLIKKLKYYAESYGRTYLCIQLGLLEAIVKFRTGEQWHEELIKAMEKACELNFTSVIAEEGAAVFELLGEIRDDVGKDDSIRRDWYEKVFLKTKNMAIKYPYYLRPAAPKIPVLSQNAANILRLQSAGLSVREIAERLSIKEATVKYHIKETYKKFGVNTKIDAVRYAEKSKII